MFIEIKTGKHLSFPDIRALHTNVVFPETIDEEQLYMLGYARVYEPSIGPVYDPMVQAVETDGYEVIDGKYCTKYKVVELSDAQKRNNHNTAVMDKVYFIEMQITPRRLRDAILTAEGTEWLKNKELEIQQLREELL